MEPPFPRCPTCGRRFDAGGLRAPSGIASDVVTYVHSEEETPCLDVYGRPVKGGLGDLVLLGKRGEIALDDINRFLSETHLVFDLGANKGRGWRVKQALRRWWYHGFGT
jgi:hypothetical protein